MKKIVSLFLACMALVLATGCTRIETGEVGLRLNASKQIEGAELMEPRRFSGVLQSRGVKIPMKALNG